MLSVGSSRITVCGQAPASTASTRSGSISRRLRRRRSASSLVTRSLVITARSMPRACRCGISRSDQRRLAGPDRTADADTGGAMGAHSCRDMVHRSMYLRLSGTDLAGCAAQQLAVGADLEGLAGRPRSAASRCCAACRVLRSARTERMARSVLPRPSLPTDVGLDRQLRHEGARPGAAAQRRSCPTSAAGSSARCRSGCALPSPIAAQAMKPRLDHHPGLDAERGARPEHQVGQPARLQRADMRHRCRRRSPG